MKHSDYHGKLLRLAMVFVALFLCGTMAYAQTDRMISGIVVDENGDPLPAAHIRQVSQTKGEEMCIRDRYWDNRWPRLRRSRWITKHR